MKGDCAYKLNPVLSYELIDPNTGSPIFFGDQISISYTLGGQEADDVKGARLNKTTPYESRRGNLTFKENTANGFILENPNLLTQLEVEFYNDVIYLDLKTEYRDFSEFGLNLPFNFMGKENGGNFDTQYLFNSPYRSFDEQFKYCYLQSIKGK